VTHEDGTIWTIRLKAGLRFSDGSPLTADDVVFTFASLMDPGSRSPKRRHWSERIAAISATDALTVRLELRRPIASLVGDLEFGIVCRRCPGTVGAGPYRVVSIAPGDVRLAANPYFVEGAPRIPKLRIRTVRDANARLVMLVGGSADLTQNTVRPDLLDAVLEQPRVQMLSGPSAILSYLMFHNEDPILRDVRVRRALALAIDREKLVRGKLGGRAVLARGLIPPGHWAFSPDVPLVPFDPDESRRLLDAAGFPDPPGPAPRFHLTYKTSTDVFRVGMARQIAGMLGEVGVEVEVRPFEFATFFADIKKGNYQMASMQTAEIPDPDLHWQYFHSERVPTPEFPDHNNRWRYRSAAADALIERGRYALDRQDRVAIYAELDRLLLTDLPIVPLWHEDNVVVANKDVRGYVVVPTARLGGLVGVEK
jgi:peptide/nickel transport system substrate-binding protein